MGLRRGLKLFRTTMSGEKIYEGVFGMLVPSPASLQLRGPKLTSHQPFTSRKESAPPM